ncbi:MAG: site-2 protease family protein [Patescibacteria group bacterium]|nr:site-2 protease family protein [Patescibacteria group bacterium]
MALLIFILIFSLLIFVHELGHFLAAKKSGIYVEEFGFGLPPRIWGKKIGETLYSINALPIGGFVKMYGEDGETGGEKRKVGNEIKGREFYSKPIWKRVIVILAGVTMNLLLAIVSFTIVYYILGIPTPTNKVQVVDVEKDSPAESVGIKAGDTIVSLAGEKVTTNKALAKIATAKAGEKVELEVKREDDPCQSKVLGGMTSEKESSLLNENSFCRNGELVFLITPRKLSPEKAVTQGPLGVIISDSEFSKNYPVWQIPFLGAKEGFVESIAWGENVLKALGSMVFGIFVKGQVPKDISGPVGIYQITKEAAKSGIVAILSLLGILSVNLAIMNVLPLPALDGGRLVFLGYEAIFKKKS